eukprot:gnl/MRDRNA2_/MRDRNA2_119176_c0_seq1.p1 gnl/MRDRNA2_/MRDRNA2_119176_c0~~gnl/MRDRNA2_/MRDRNA2_119176_c0_seq1.p1  ORF type:complete len:501 (-),score=87.06 gnl/MRDRNA2_/MRDRNA2_119176_c0_seq1:30-1403(-)
MPERESYSAEVEDSPKQQFNQFKTNNSRVPPQHHQWAVENWVKLDRDHDGLLTRSELDSKEFRALVAELIHGSRQHVMVNVQGLLDWVQRKADGNGDDVISFAEFEGFTNYLRQLSDPTNLTRDAPSAMADLVFAMFDLNGDDVIDREEYREVDRFFRGGRPKEVDFDREWVSLDSKGEQMVSRERYAAWLREGASQVMPPPGAQGPGPSTHLSAHGKSSPLATGLSPKSLKANADGTAKHPFKWNRRHHIHSGQNSQRPQGQRTYFSRAQTVDELRRHLESKPESSLFRSLCVRLNEKEEPRRRPVLSQDAGMPMDVARHTPGGTMRNGFGEPVFWNDRWEQSISRDNATLHPLHREYFDCSSVYACSASQKWRRMKDFQKQPGQWAPIEEKRLFALEPEEMEPEMEHRDIRKLNHRLSIGGGIEKQGCQSPSRKTFCLLTAVPEKKMARSWSLTM